MSVGQTEFVLIFWRTILTWAILCIPYRIHGKGRQNKRLGPLLRRPVWVAVVISTSNPTTSSATKTKHSGQKTGKWKKASKESFQLEKEKGEKFLWSLIHLNGGRLKSEPVFRKRPKLQDQRLCFVLLVSYQGSLTIEDKTLSGKAASSNALRLYTSIVGTCWNLSHFYFLTFILPLTANWFF